jgi:hypothetical protein
MKGGWTVSDFVQNGVPAFAAIDVENKQFQFSNVHTEEHIP